MRNYIFSVRSSSRAPRVFAFAWVIACRELSRVIVFSALPEHFAPGIFEHKIDQSIIRPEKLVVVFSLCSLRAVLMARMALSLSL